MAKKKTEEKEQMTMEEYLVSQLEEPVLLKGGEPLKQNGRVITKNEAIATNILNLAMKGDLKAAQFVMNLQRMNKKK